MISRLKRITFAIACLTLAYLGYAFVVVPFIEPSTSLSAGKSTGRRSSLRDRHLADLFPPGSWELDRPWLVETLHGTLLFDKYTAQPKGQLKLSRCTVICYVDSPRPEGGTAGPHDPRRRPIILRAAGGATLDFGNSLNVLQGQFGKMVGGLLDGEITISSPASEPGRDDELEIVTKNVQLDRQRIWTPHEVRFRYGGNVGRGRDLTIHLAGSSKSAENTPSLGIRGVRSMELVHLDRLQLQLNGSGLFEKHAGAGRTSRETKSARGESDKSAPSHVEVSCRGPFRFDFQQQVLSLEDHVDLVRHNVNGPSDQLLCQLLEIYFDTAKRPEATHDANAMAAAPSKQKFGKLAPSRVVAVGYPVIIRAASAGVGTRAERIEYDCIHRRIWLKDQDKVMFHDSEREVEARELQYTFEENERLGVLIAVGPGIVRGTVGADARKFIARWNGQVHMRPIDSSPVLTLTHHVHFELADTGSFDAENLHVFLKEEPKPGDPAKTAVSIDRLHATGNVVVQSRTISCTVDEAKLWFESARGKDPSVASPSASSHVPAFGGAGANSLLASGRSEDAATRRQAFAIRARLIEALIFLGDKPVVDRLNARGGIELVEVSSQQSQPLVIRGESFELQDGASEHPRGALQGELAEVLARGLRVRAPRFYVYPLDNLLRIDGAGEMEIPSQVAMQGKNEPSDPAFISWKKSLQFDGSAARLEGDVSLRGARRTRDGNMRFLAMGDILHIALTRRVDFQDPQLEGPANLEEMGFEDWGYLETELFDHAGERSLVEQMQVRNLRVNQTSGEIRGEGPGWLRGIHRGRDILGEVSGAPRVPLASGLDSTGLNFLRVDFDGMLSGNLHRRQIEFLNGTRTLYGPVAAWNESLDELAPGDLPPEAVLVSCDRLAVQQPSVDQDSSGNVELEATGNAYVQGSAFSARGGRISYVKSKDQLVLEGDGRNDATLSFQRQLGSPPSEITAGKIKYSPGTRQFQLVDFHKSDLFDVGQFGGRNANAAKPR